MNEMLRSVARNCIRTGEEQLKTEPDRLYSAEL
jgi:hypothetical protein